MNRIVVVLMAVLLPVISAGCKKTVTGTDTGTVFYFYSAFDSSGTVTVVSGNMFVDWTDSANITGSWDLNLIGRDHEVGPQLGRGLLRGTLSGVHFVLTLNPAVEDDNVTLTGTFPDAGTMISGTWEWSTLAGIRERGTFTLHPR